MCNLNYKYNIKFSVEFNKNMIYIYAHWYVEQWSGDNVLIMIMALAPLWNFAVGFSLYVHLIAFIMFSLYSTVSYKNKFLGYYEI